MTRHSLSVLEDGVVREKVDIEASADEHLDHVLLRAVSVSLLEFPQALFEHVVEYRLSDTGGLNVASVLLLATKSLPVE